VHAVCDVEQLPPQVPLLVVQGAWPDAGAPVTCEQVPTWPETLHAWHCPVQSLSQQTPSPRWPETHWLGTVAAVPFASFGLHVVELQKSPATQSLSFAQVVLHAVEPHT
jgi:hypothetical protein